MDVLDLICKPVLKMQWPKPVLGYGVLWDMQTPQSSPKLSAVGSELLVPSHRPTRSKSECKQGLSTWAAPCLKKTLLSPVGLFLSEDEVVEVPMQTLT